MTVTFSLPDWVLKYDYSKRTYFDKSHQWAGQVKSDTIENEVADYLWQLKHSWSEIGLHPMGPFVKYKLDVGEDDTIPVVQIVKLRMQLENALEGHFKSGKRKPHGDVY
jgi:hypothetical protein